MKPAEAVSCPANIHFDSVSNKVDYHFPQARILALWEDAWPVITKQRPPEPLVMRMNTFDCVQYQQTNLVPATYEMDDYQVRTPTDVIGQHIHLPKWDLVAADGSSNGWNYEDGVLSPGAVQERIQAIREFNDTALPYQILKYARLGRRTVSPDLAGVRTWARAVTIATSVDEWVAALRAQASRPLAAPVRLARGSARLRRGSG